MLASVLMDILHLVIFYTVKPVLRSYCCQTANIVLSTAASEKEAVKKRQGCRGAKIAVKVAKLL